VASRLRIAELVKLAGGGQHSSGNHPVRTRTTLGGAARTLVGVVAAVTFAVMSGLVLMLLGLVFAPH